MFNFSGVWDEKMKRRTVAFVGIVLLIMVGYMASIANGLPIHIRFFL